VSSCTEAPDLPISTDEWPELQRRQALLRLYGQTIWAAEHEPMPDRPVYIDGRFRILPGLRVADVSCSSPRRARRSRAHLSEDFCLHICLSGSRSLSQRGREETIGYGEAILTSGLEPSAVSVAASRFVTFAVPARAILPRVPDLEDRVARPIRRDNAALQLLTVHASILHDPRALSTPEARRLAVAQIYDLLALALAPTQDIAQSTGARTARLRAIKGDILDNLGADLSVNTVAARHRLPVRYVQRLFESEGLSFTAYVVEQRLLRAHGMLTDPRLADHPVGLIAFEAGFGHLPYFNRAFRNRFGDTPTGVRMRARRDQ
jgi:AraC-like DNA-binding protein